MGEYGVVPEAGAVRFERILPGPIERAWSYLTDSERSGTWLAAGPMELCVGGAVELHFRQGELSPHAQPTPERYRTADGDNCVSGRITRCEPPTLLSYTWGEGTGDASEVTFELIPQGEEVRLVLTHRRLGDRATMVNVAGGWHTHLAILGDRLADAEPRPFWSTHARAEREYAGRLPVG